MMRRDEQGMALVVTLMAMLLLSVLGAALILTTSADAMIAANAGAASDAFYAAEAAFERTLAELRRAPDFTSVLIGAFTSAFVDDPAAGPRALSDGTLIDLREILNLANCAKRRGCAEADLNAAIRDRPWGVRNPRWRLFASGPLVGASAVGSARTPAYVVIMVADDPAESDADPWQDGARTTAEVNPGAGVLLVRAEAFGGRGAHRVVEGTVVRRDLVARAVWEVADPAIRGLAPSSFPVLQVLAWREVR
jgi:type IV pilus assembly PilX-like protein